MAQNGFGPAGGLHALAVSVGRVNSAETATERAADAGLMCGRSFTKKRRTEVLLGGNSVEWTPGKCVRTLHLTLGVMPMQPEDILVRQARNRIESALTAQGAEQLQKSLFSLTPHDVVDITRVQGSVGINRREIAPPDDGNFRKATADLPTALDGSDHLRSGHNGHAQKFDGLFVNEP